MKAVAKYSILAVAVLLVVTGIIFTNLASHGLILVNEEGFEIDSKHLESNEPTLVISISGSERRIEIKEGIERSIPYSEENLSSLKKDIEDGTVFLSKRQRMPMRYFSSKPLTNSKTKDSMLELKQQNDTQQDTRLNSEQAPPPLH